MAAFRFVGEYTNGRTSIEHLGVTFEGHEPSEVSDDVALQLLDQPEFEEVDPLDHDGDGRKGGSRKKAAPAE